MLLKTERAASSSAAVVPPRLDSPIYLGVCGTPHDTVRLPLLLTDPARAVHLRDVSLLPSVHATRAQQHTQRFDRCNNSPCPCADMRICRAFLLPSLGLRALEAEGVVGTCGSVAEPFGRLVQFWTVLVRPNDDQWRLANDSVLRMLAEALNVSVARVHVWEITEERCRITYHTRHPTGHATHGTPLAPSQTGAGHSSLLDEWGFFVPTAIIAQPPLDIFHSSPVLPTHGLFASVLGPCSAEAAERSDLALLWPIRSRLIRHKP